jgi:uncharacterized membrane protein (UPF0182 family)
MIVTPLHGTNTSTMLYIKPLYLQGDVGQLPQLRRIYFVLGDGPIVQATSLKEGLAKLYAGAASGQAVPSGEVPNAGEPATSPITSTAPISGSVTIDGSGLTQGEVDAINALIEEMRKSHGR